MSVHLGGFMSITPYVFGELINDNYILNEINFSAFQVRKSYIRVLFSTPISWTESASDLLSLTNPGRILTIVGKFSLAVQKSAKFTAMGARRSRMPRLLSLG